MDNKESLENNINDAQYQIDFYGNQILNLWAVEYIEDGFLRKGIKFKSFINAREEHLKVLRGHQHYWMNILIDLNAINSKSVS